MLLLLLFKILKNVWGHSGRFLVTPFSFETELFRLASQRPLSLNIEGKKLLLDGWNSEMTVPFKSTMYITDGLVPGSTCKSLHFKGVNVREMDRDIALMVRPSVQQSKLLYADVDN